MNESAVRRNPAIRTPPRKQNPIADRPKPQKRAGKPPVAENKLPAGENKRIAQQTRQILGKHYASKYRVR